MVRITWVDISIINWILVNKDSIIDEINNNIVIETKYGDKMGNTKS